MIEASFPESVQPFPAEPAAFVLERAFTVKGLYYVKADIGTVGRVRRVALPGHPKWQGEITCGHVLVRGKTAEAVAAALLAHVQAGSACPKCPLKRASRRAS